MSSTLDQAYSNGIKPYLDGQLAGDVAIARTVQPLKKFMLAQARENDLQLFTKLSGKEQFASPDEVPLSVLVPTFLTSELKTAFQIGFMVFIPFLVIDLVVASVLMSMGMMMLSPVLVSLPFKIMLFVVVDGWTLLIGTLAGELSPMTPETVMDLAHSTLTGHRDDRRTAAADGARDRPASSACCRRRRRSTRRR